MMNKELSDKYDYLCGLLLYFLIDTYLDNPIDLETVKRFVKENEKHQIKKLLLQGNEVLKLDPFPAQWIQDTCNKYPFDQGHETELKDYYPWLQWVIKTLKEEAKKAGKI